MRLLSSLALVGITVALAGCGGSPASPAAAPAPSSAGAPPAATQCEGAHLGQTGVISLQCNGTATVKATVGSLTKQITGGVCTTSSGLFVVNAGVVTDHTFAGTRPDFLSVNTPVQGGGGPDTAVSVLLDGRFYGDSGRFGGQTTFTADHKGLTFTGSATDGETATIVVSGC